MNDFVKKVIEGKGITPSTNCLQTFNQNFETAINVDWFDRGDYFEAVFYKDNIEHIVKIDYLGTLLEYKQFLPDGYLPESIKIKLENRGEIMNAVLINKGNTIEYEVILRDGEFNRFLITLTDMGKILEDKIL
jgi:hypothetical protein